MPFLLVLASVSIYNLVSIITTDCCVFVVHELIASISNEGRVATEDMMETANHNSSLMEHLTND